MREFREAVRVWSCEGVEKVLVQDRGVNVDMIIRDKVENFPQSGDNLGLSNIHEFVCTKLPAPLLSAHKLAERKRIIVTILHLWKRCTHST